MTFRFKLFKALTGINLFVTGFFLLLNFTSMLMGAFSQGLVSIVMFGGVFIHAILSAYLQRSLQEPGFTLKENTPGGIRIMGGYSILIGALMLLCAIAIFIVMNVDLKEMSGQITDEQRQQLEAIKSLRGTTIMQIVFFLYGSAIIVNALLSLSFLQQWKKKQEDDKHIDLDLDA